MALVVALDKAMYSDSMLDNAIVFLACSNFSMCNLAQHLSDFDSTHWKAIKQVLRYINGTCSFGI